MINLSLNRHDFLYAVEGFASGSHLRQHVWQEIVYKSIPQMSDDDMTTSGSICDATSSSDTSTS